MFLLTPMTLEARITRLEGLVRRLLTAGGGGGGTTDHSALSNLAYASAGHTGFAPSASGVTNGDSHDHSGGDGAQINHTTLSNIGSNTHAQIDTHISDSSDPHGATLTQTTIAATTVVTGDHGTAATDQVVNVCYGTGAAPTASTTTEGALYIVYTA